MGCSRAAKVLRVGCLVSEMFCQVLGLFVVVRLN
jgi:hypothetical protein